MVRWHRVPPRREAAESRYAWSQSHFQKLILYQHERFNIHRLVPAEMWTLPDVEAVDPHHVRKACTRSL